jgi:hypothetical protein
VGWEYVHVCVDDATPVAFAKVMPTEKKRCAVAFLRAAASRMAAFIIATAAVCSLLPWP